IPEPCISRGDAASLVSFPQLHLSKPGVVFPATCVDNAETIRRVRACFKGTEEQFAAVAGAIEHVLGLCKTKVRYLEVDVRPGAVADYAVAAAKQCLDVNNVSLDEIDLVIGGG